MTTRKIIGLVGLTFTFAIFFSSSVSLAATFNDIENHPYEKSIELLATEGIIGGYKDGSFKPNQKINRAEFLKIALEAAIIIEKNLYYASTYGTGLGFTKDTIKAYAHTNTFKDVPSNEWYTDYVTAAHELRWITGYDNEKYFKPTKNVSFVEALSMTYSILPIIRAKTEVPGPWYKSFVDFASEENRIPLSISAFDTEITRGEMADHIARIMKDITGGLEIFLENKSDMVVTYDTIKNNQPPTKRTYYDGCPNGTRQVMKLPPMGYTFCYDKATLDNGKSFPEGDPGYIKLTKTELKKTTGFDIYEYINSAASESYEISNITQFENDNYIGLAYDTRYDGWNHGYTMLFDDLTESVAYEFAFSFGSEDKKGFKEEVQTKKKLFKTIEKTFKWLGNL